MRTLTAIALLFVLAMGSFGLWHELRGHALAASANPDDYRIASFHDGAYSIVHGDNKFTARCYLKIFNGSTVDGPDVCTHPLHSVGTTISTGPRTIPPVGIPGTELWYVVGASSQRMHIDAVEPGH